MLRTLCIAVALVEISLVASLVTQPKRQGEKDLPQVSAVLRAPRQVATKLTSKLQLFEAKLAAASRKASNQVQAKKAKYEKVLKAEVTEVDALRSNNTKLLEYIDAVRNVNAQQRRHAEELRTTATNLRSELQRMQSNITFVQQLMDESLTSSEESMKATPLNVLKELQDVDTKENEQKARKLRLLAITKHKKTKSVMLQFPAQASFDLNGKAQELLSSMSSGLDEYYSDQHDALATMEQSFLKDQAALNGTRDELQKENAELDSIKASEDDLHNRLKAAVKTLEKATEHLTQKVNAVRGFTKRMGQKAMPVALLQDAQTKPLLPWTPTFMDTSKDKSHSSQVSLLKKNVKSKKTRSVPWTPAFMDMSKMDHYKAKRQSSQVNVGSKQPETSRKNHQ